MADTIAADTPARPVLTFPRAAAQVVREFYAKCSVILEYGTGGSTALASETEGLLAFSVESDAAWMANLQRWLDANPPKADVRLHYADIGQTKEWGYPAGNGSFRKWPGYALSVWERPDFSQPDAILIDGRFRIACFLTAMLRSTAPVTVLWDDYGDRPHYHQVEAYARPMAMHGRLARFELEPMPLPQPALRLLAESFIDPR